LLYCGVKVVHFKHIYNKLHLIYFCLFNYGRQLQTFLAVVYSCCYSYDMVCIAGKCLPSARNVSKVVHMSSNTIMKMSHTHSHMLMLWGQFLDHDITLTPQRQTLTSCCTYDGVWRDSENTGWAIFLLFQLFI